MELELHRVDLLQSSAAAPGTLLVLPPGENKTQKVVVGDLSGVVQCFSVKKGEVTLSFKTLPSQDKVQGLHLSWTRSQCSASVQSNTSFHSSWLAPSHFTGPCTVQNPAQKQFAECRRSMLFVQT
eukprot:GHUV01048354.1.p2 GENE.GHUV01048354.1~~GHUV01048354.1.p2  ORF type:complete len:125 (+),score=18.20 GHUV01048354.1:461-835(+)